MARALKSKVLTSLARVLELTVEILKILEKLHQTHVDGFHNDSQAHLRT